MPLAQRRFTRRVALKVAVLALAGSVFVGCDEDRVGLRKSGPAVIVGSFHIAGGGMYEAFERWRTSLTPDNRKVIEELIRREDLLFHVFLGVGRLDPELSRGGKSGWASSPTMKPICDFHPIAGRFAPERNWDVVSDPEARKVFEEVHGIPNPPEVILHHEIFGHDIPTLRNLKVIDTRGDQSLDEPNECDALEVENRYRRQIGFQEVPPDLIGCPSR